MKDLLIAVLNSDAVQTLILFGVVYVGGKIFAKWPKVRKFYDQYKGEMVRIVKTVETEIPDGTENKALARADKALQYIIQLIEKRENRTLTEKEKAELSNDMNEVHFEVETNGAL